VYHTVDLKLFSIGLKSAFASSAVHMERNMHIFQPVVSSHYIVQNYTQYHFLSITFWVSHFEYHIWNL